MRQTPQIHRASTRAFTLPELLVAAFVSVLVVVGVLSLTIQSFNIYYYDSGRLLVNHDNRKFTMDLEKDAVYSSYFLIYKDFTARSRVDAGVTVEDNLTDGKSGDFLLLVFAVTSPTNGTTQIHKLVGYYRDLGPSAAVANTTTVPLRKFEVDAGGVVLSQTYHMYDLLNAVVPASGSSSWPIVIANALGNAADPVTPATKCRLFYNFAGQSAIVSGRFYEGGNLRQRHVVNTYNFAVSPRG